MREASAATVNPLPRRHLLAAAVGVGVAALWAVSLAASVEAIGSRRDRSGSVVAVFPRSMSEAEVLARVSRAGGLLVGATWLANAWHVHGDASGFSGALQDGGATLVLPPLPYGALGMLGCGAAAPQAR